MLNLYRADDVVYHGGTMEVTGRFRPIRGGVAYVAYYLGPHKPQAVLAKEFRPKLLC
jgi:hypothetical protein